MSCRVKICGITNLADALHASDCGADALGFVFYDKSPRYISPEEANQIVAQLPPFITPVALFVDAEDALIESVVSGSSRWTLQFHGNESPEQCQQWQRPYFKAIRMKPEMDILSEACRYASATAVLLDAYKAGVPGGTGEVFDWHLIPDELSKPLILAGGLTPENVEDAVNTVQPYAVDVSGGVEQQKGVKDPIKVMQFINGAKRG
ncbi:phosphoribosylanthranilate isomerase [Marinomonas ostreistagni]|uniref:N-(5'-phosphoribosyl)anthranilate isomerase n=1 Tax=Marinomonas ostreistagni TaxID=359209 RepID=A0ABS0ZEX5_9GAMM|nr:phosphoribosylanthranilate isomerase [Marinomonas ostreistagni]MBJ7552229.1 phosphoribosylanthranilate isomerase [Marinomonas ostreistagni]